MVEQRLRTSSLVAIALLVGACTSAGDASLAPSGTPLPARTGPPSTASPSSPGSPAAATSSPLASAAATEIAVIDAPWAQTELTDVTSGEPFRIADLAGKTVILETMAIWCANCRAQQGDVYRALDDLDPDRVAYVLLDVDPSETGPALADYRTQNGFTGIYAVAGRETARALAQEFGDQVLNPPSTPMILIGTDGRITLTDFGHKSPDTVIQLARDHGA